MIRLIRPMALFALLALLLTAGCATAPQPGEPAAEEEPDTGEAAADETAEGEEAATAPAADCPPNCDFARDAIDEGGVLADRTIYFDFDSSDVEQEYMAIIERHAAYLTQYPDTEVRVEGHADERGSREYNIGLGARRSSSVQELMQVYGVGSGQIETISYGEEMPAAEGHSEDAWSQNRRAELVYPGR